MSLWIWPQALTKIIGLFAVLFDNDRTAPEDPNERLKWHQKKSGPIMVVIKIFWHGLVGDKVWVPSSGLGIGSG